MRSMAPRGGSAPPSHDTWMWSACSRWWGQASLPPPTRRRLVSSQWIQTSLRRGVGVLYAVVRRMGRNTALWYTRVMVTEEMRDQVDNHRTVGIKCEGGNCLTAQACTEYNRGKHLQGMEEGQQDTVSMDLGGPQAQRNPPPRPHFNSQHPAGFVYKATLASWTCLRQNWTPEMMMRDPGK